MADPVVALRDGSRIRRKIRASPGFRDRNAAITYLSSNAWDAYAASAFGMQVVWCNRYGQRRERLPGSPDREVFSLEQLPALVGAT